MYKLIKESNAVTRLRDGAYIPDCLDNTAYKEYLVWVEAGNTPVPAVTPEEALAAEKAIAREWRDTELARADIQLLKVQDGVTGIGTQKAWREYRCALRDWPTSDSFPYTQPSAPDAK